MDLKLQGKRALVTGSSKGIGEAIARVLAREGATVIVRTPTFFINSPRHDGDFERRRFAKRLARQLATTNDPAGDTRISMICSFSMALAFSDIAQARV